MHFHKGGFALAQCTNPANETTVIHKKRRKQRKRHDPKGHHSAMWSGIDKCAELLSDRTQRDSKPP